MPLTFQYINDKPLLHVDDLPQLLGNINGPSLIKVPDWFAQPLGRYYLYFAHHEGTSIRLAFADDLLGPWTVHEPGALQLADSGFCVDAPKPEDMHPAVRVLIEQGADGDYPHIASPDVHVDHETQRIRLYFHGRVADGSQQTRLATSRDGLHFDCHTESLGLPYFRVFEYEEWFYAIAFNGWIFRSKDGESGFVQGHRLTNEDLRHCAVATDHAQDAKSQHKPGVAVFWSRVTDNPEAILVSKLDTTGDWQNWSLRDTCLLHQPTRSWEGAELPLQASSYGGVMHAVRQLRDPAIYLEGDRSFLLYSIAGEQGIAIGELVAT